MDVVSAAPSRPAAARCCSSSGQAVRSSSRPPPHMLAHEKSQILKFVLADQFQHLRVTLRSSQGLPFLGINELMPQGEWQGLSLLHLSVLVAGPSTVSTLLQLAEADANLKAEPAGNTPPRWRGATPLHLAAERGAVKSLKNLIVAGGSVHALDKQLRSPLMYALEHASAEGGHQACVKELIWRGAEVNCLNAAGDGPFHISCSRGEASLGLIKEHPAHTTVLSEEASLRAVRQGQDATNKEGQTPLWRACKGGLGVCALFLIELGCAPSSPALDGRTPLHMACLTGLEEVVKRMLALPEVDVDAIAANGQSPLHIALAQSSAAHRKIAKMLLARGARPYGRASNGESVLHSCAREGHLELTATLLHQLKCDNPSDRGMVNWRNRVGSTPLHTAVAHNQNETARLLMQQEGIDRAAHDTHGMTALHQAVEMNNVRVFSLLLTSTLHRVSSDEISLRNGLGWAPLHTAAFQGLEVASRMLLEAKAFVDLKTTSGWTPLQLASSQGHMRTAAVLLDGGADLFYSQPTVQPAMVLAATREHKRTLQLLQSRAELQDPQSIRSLWFSS